MELLSKSGQIPSELVPTAIAWGQGMALVIEAMLYDHDTVSEVWNEAIADCCCLQCLHMRKPPVLGGLLLSGSSYVPRCSSAERVILT